MALITSTSTSGEKHFKCCLLDPNQKKKRKRNTWASHCGFHVGLFPGISCQTNRGRSRMQLLPQSRSCFIIHQFNWEALFPPDRGGSLNLTQASSFEHKHDNAIDHPSSWQSTKWSYFPKYSTIPSTNTTKIIRRLTIKTWSKADTQKVKMHYREGGISGIMTFSFSFS